MNRDVKFRGRALIKKDRWIYGDLVTNNGKNIIMGQMTSIDQHAQTIGNLHHWSIIAPATFVDPETVCQYTGLKDKNGVEIYEDDIVKVSGDRKLRNVFFSHGAFLVGYHNGSSTSLRPKLIQANVTDIANRIEVVGNLHEDADKIEGFIAPIR